jgi:hypothetical protein
MTTKPTIAVLAALVMLSSSCLMQAQQTGTGGGGKSGTTPPGESGEFNIEVRAPFSYQLTSGQSSELGLGAEIYYYTVPQVHSEKFRSFFAEEVRGNTSIYHLAINYEPRSDLTSDLRTTTRGYTVVAEGVFSLGGKFGAGAYLRTSSSNLALDAPTSDYEFGPQLSYWSTRRTYLNEKLSYRSISGELNPLNPLNNPLIDPGGQVSPIERDKYVQLYHHISYLIGEDWGFTYAHDLRLLLGILGTPHANNLSFYNYFIFSPSARYSFGPVVGVNLDYLVGRGTSTLSIPLGGRLELFSGPFAAELEGSYTINTIQEQPNQGWIVRGVAGYRF